MAMNAEQDMGKRRYNDSWADQRHGSCVEEVYARSKITRDCAQSSPIRFTNAKRTEDKEGTEVDQLADTHNTEIADKVEKHTCRS